MRLLYISTFWLTRLGQISPNLERPILSIQVDFFISFNMIKNSLITYPPLEQPHCLIQVDCKILIDQFKNSFPTQATLLHSLSWLYNLPWSSKELIRFWVIWLDRSKSISLSYRFTLISLSILRDIIGPIYLSSCTSIKIPHWIIIQKL